MELGWLCAVAAGTVAIAVVGHLLWIAAASVLKPIFSHEEGERPRPARPFRYCPACDADTDPADRDCPRCRLDLDGRLARELHRVRVAEREVRKLTEADQIDRDAAQEVLAQLKARARSLRGLPTTKPRA